MLSTLSERKEAWRSSDLVARHPSTNDGRGAEVTLTDQGWTVLREAAPPHHHVHSVRHNLVDLLDEEEIATLSRMTEKVIARLSD